MITADLEFHKLCTEIDSWKAEAEYWREECNKLSIEYNKLLDDSIKHGNTMMGNMLKAVLSSDPKKLAENFS